MTFLDLKIITYRETNEPSMRKFAIYVISISVDKPSKRTEPPNQKTKQSAYAKTKTQISCAVTAQLISAFVFATWIV